MRSLSFLSYVLIVAVTPSVCVAGGFQATCRNIRVGGIWMNADCGDGHGGWPLNAISIGQCVGVKADGTMQCGYVLHTFLIL